MMEASPEVNSIARLPKPGQAASVRGPSNQVLSEVLRAGRESTAELSPLSTPDSILIRHAEDRIMLRNIWPGPFPSAFLRISSEHSTA